MHFTKILAQLPSFTFKKEGKLSQKRQQGTNRVI